MPLILARTVGELYLRRIRETPHAVGFQVPSLVATKEVSEGWKRVTFREFDSECRLVSFGLTALGARSGDRVAIFSSTRYEWQLADMAAIGASCVPVPVYPSLRIEDAANLLRDSACRFAFVESFGQLERLLALRPSLPALDKLVLLDPPPVRSGGLPEGALDFHSLKELGRREQARNPEGFEARLAALRPSDLLTICYTSGTTGEPKGAMLTHDNMVSVLEDCAQVLGPELAPETEVVASFLPFSHILGRVESLATYVFGWKECFTRGPESFHSALRELRPTLLFAVPLLFERVRAEAEAQAARAAGRLARRNASVRPPSLLKRVWSKAALLMPRELMARLASRRLLAAFGGKLRFAICGGAPLDRGLAEFFENAGIRILEGYGLTETCGPVAVNSNRGFRLGTVGKPLPEVAIKIAEDGEILVKSRKVFSGYLGKPQDTRAAFRDGWLRTGDVGRIDKRGFLTITDRKKDIIILSGGKNIAPQKIENLARAQEYVREIVVDGEGQGFLSALVTLDREKIIRYANEHQVLFSDYSQLIRHPKIEGLIQRSIDAVNSQLSPFEAIRRFIILPEDFTIHGGELTPSLKVRRKAIRARFELELESLRRSP